MRRVTSRTDLAIGFGALLAGVGAVAILALALMSGGRVTQSVPGGHSSSVATTTEVEPSVTPSSSALISSASPSASPPATPSAAPSPTPIPIVSAALPLVACSTTYGGGEDQAPLPKTETVRIRADLATRLAVFATNYDRVLAPRGWRCDAEVGANGTAHLSLSTRADEAASIVVENAANTYGDVIELACPLFPEAARLVKEQYGETCVRPDDKEVVRSSGRTIKRFEDPPFLAATGEGSGGAYASIGGILFVGGSEPTAAKISCVLPPERRATCVAVVGDWIGRVR